MANDENKIILEFPATNVEIEFGETITFDNISGFLDSGRVTYNGESLTEEITHLEDGKADKNNTYTKTQVDTITDTKMDKNNPTGTGSFSLNRKSGTTVGFDSVAMGGRFPEASGDYSIALGDDAMARGENSFSVGKARSEGRYSVAIGNGVIAQGDNQIVIGKNNIVDTENKYVEIVGNGLYSLVGRLSNARTLDWQGNETLAGDLTYNGNKSLTSEISRLDGRIDNLPAPMIFKGTLGVGGTIQSLPTASASNEGFTYKVITDGTYAGQTAKVGDVFTSNGFEWVLIPAGDEDNDTWRAIKINGVEKLGNGISSGAVDFVGSENIDVEFDSNGNKVGIKTKNIYTKEESDDKFATKTALEEVSNEVENIRIGADGTTYSSAGDAVRAIGSDVNNIKDVIWHRQSRTIVHSNDELVVGYYYISNRSKATLNTSTSYYSIVTDISNIPVGSKIVTKSSIASGTGMIIFDADYNVLDYITSTNAEDEGYEISTAPVDITLTVPANAKYVSASIRSVLYTDISQFTVNYNNIENVVDNMRNDLDVLADYAHNSNPLYDKKWAVLGDSFTNGATSTKIQNGRYKGQNYVYPYLIGNRNNMNIVSFFGGGRTLAYPSTGDFDNSVTNPSASYYYQNIPLDADYITIYLGINDSHHENGVSGDGEDVTGVIPLGTINDETTATYYGAWNVVLTWLIENRPFAHIGIIVSNGVDREAYRTAQLEIAQKYGIPFIDLNGDERTPVMIRSKNPNIASAVKTMVTRKQAVDYDGTQTGTVNTHPNDDAHAYESTFIENFLRSI